MTPQQVVRVLATVQRPDYDCPWQMQSPTGSTGSGVVLPDGRVLTGAHVVADATFVQVQTATHPRKYLARVVATAHDCDLALLAIDGPAFTEATEPATLGALPRRRDEVVVVGFPVGGEEVSYTEGVVSRIELSNYTHSHRRLLAITVDAAINPGNSGGPAYDAEGRLVGIAFQKRRDADGIGYLVPAVLVRRFLDAVALGRSTEAPALGLRLQTIENPTLRAALGVPEGHEGVRVVETGHGGSAWGRLAVDDVVTHIDGHAIAANGTITWEGGLRTGLAVALSRSHVGDGITLRALRHGEPFEMKLALQPDASLVPRDRHDVRPDWLIYGGLVIQPLGLDYLQTWSKLREAPREMVLLYARAMRSPERRQALVISKVLAHGLNQGYGHFADRIIAAVDGVVPRDLGDLAQRLDRAKGVVRIATTSGGMAVFDAAAVRAETAELLARYRIPCDRSEGLSSTDHPTEAL